VSMVPAGSVECRTCCFLYITLVNSLSSATSTSSSTVCLCIDRVLVVYDKINDAAAAADDDDDDELVSRDFIPSA